MINLTALKQNQVLICLHEIKCNLNLNGKNNWLLTTGIASYNYYNNILKLKHILKNWELYQNRLAFFEQIFLV